MKMESTIRPRLNEVQAANHLGKSLATLRRWRWLQIGPPWCKPPGTKTPYYLESDIDGWIESGRVETDTNA